MKHIIALLFALIMVSCTTQQESKIDYGSNSAAGKYMDINGIKVYYETYGNGEPLLLLHGNGGSIESFTYQIPELSKHFKVIAMDSRAQGRTTDSDQEITYALMASDVSALIDKLNLGKVNVVGWSDGGNIGLELAYAHPEKVLKVVAIGANYTHENALTSPNGVVMDQGDPLFVKTAEMKEKYLTSAQRLSPDTLKLPEIRKKLTKLMDEYPNFTTDQLKTIKVPFLVIAGDHDAISLEHTLSLYNNLPQSELFIVPHASHLLLFENPEIINNQVIRFLKEKYSDIDPFYFAK